MAKKSDNDDWDYHSSIREQERQLRRQIRATKHPIFNLRRLIEGPFPERPLFGTSRSKEVILQIKVWVAAGLMMILTSLFNRSIYDIPGLIVFLHMSNYLEWYDRRNELKVERKKLRGIDFGQMLEKALREKINEAKEKLFGECGIITKHRQELRVRISAEMNSLPYRKTDLLQEFERRVKEDEFPRLEKMGEKNYLRYMGRSGGVWCSVKRLPHRIDLLEKITIAIRDSLARIFAEAHQLITQSNNIRVANDEARNVDEKNVENSIIDDNMSGSHVDRQTP